MKKIALGVLLLIGACKETRPPQPTAEQSGQLNEAEDMLNDMAANSTAANETSKGEVR